MTGSSAIDAEVSLPCLFDPSQFILNEIGDDDSTTFRNVLVEELPLSLREGIIISS
jgi:hypothetical protein